MDLNWLQWPASAATFLAVAGFAHKRAGGFVANMIGNVLWIAWGWHVGGVALIGLNVAIFAMSAYGLWRWAGDDGVAA